MMEQLYQNFTTQVLPQIQEGLIIGKEYFFDLFGRYINYLLIIDIIWATIGLIIIIIAIIIIKKAMKREEEMLNKYADPTKKGLMILIAIGMIIIGIPMFLYNLTYIAKDIYIPEIRIIEIIQKYNNK